MGVCSFFELCKYSLHANNHDIYNHKPIIISSQLQNADADTFEYNELKEAMLKTISQLNEWADEANITEVCTQTPSFFFLATLDLMSDNNLHSPLF